MPSVNEELQDRAVRHLMYLTRLQTQEANKVLRFIDNDVIPDIEDQMTRRLSKIRGRGFDPGPATTKRLDEMFRDFRQINKKNFREIKNRTRQSVTDLAEQEAQWQAGTVNDVLNVDVDWNFPSQSQLRNAVLRRPFDGARLDDWFDGLNRSTQRNMERAIRQGIVQGESVGQMVRRVRGTRAAGFADGVLNTTRRQAETIVRSSVIHSSAQGREVLYEENKSLIDKVQWVATLDSHTCPVCGDLDGQVFDVGSGERPIAHPNCRCTTVPVLKSAKEVGIDLPDLPEGTRASMDGQVPASMNYNSWLRKNVNSGRMDVVEEALGKTRAKMFAAGGLDVSDFVAGGRTLSLAQLRRREREVFSSLNVRAPKSRSSTRPPPAPKNPPKDIKVGARPFDREIPPGDIGGTELTDSSLTMYHITDVDSAKKIVREGFKADATNTFQGFESQINGVYGWASEKRAWFEANRMISQVGMDPRDIAIIKVRIPKKMFGKLRPDEDFSLDPSLWRESLEDLASVAVEGNVSARRIKEVLLHNTDDFIERRNSILGPVGQRQAERIRDTKKALKPAQPISSSTERSSRRSARASSDTPSGSSASSVGRTLKEMEARDGNEHMIVLDRKGNRVLTQTSGQKHSVSLNREQARKLDKGSGYEVHHNHPTHGSLSPADLEMTSKLGGVSRIHAHGPGGSLYSGNIVDNVKFRKSLSTAEAELDSLFTSLVRERIVSPSNMAALEDHILNLVLKDVGAISYSAKLPSRLEDALKKMQRTREFDIRYSRLVKRLKERS